MKKLFALVLCLSIFATSQAQQLKELSLSDAILKQRSSLAPERIANLQWMSKTENITHLSADRSEIIQKSKDGKKSETIATLTELNGAFELAMKRIPGITWMNANEFYFSYSGGFYSYNIASRKGSTLLELPKKAANIDFNKTNKKAAFTVNNNLYVASKSNKQKAIFTSDDPNIVTGQAIARYEFGISKGTFWSPQGNLLAYYQKDETDVADYPILDITTTPGSLRNVKYPMAGQKSEYGKVGVYNMVTNKNIFLEVDGPKDQYLTNLSWSPDEQTVFVAVVNRDQNHMWLNAYDSNTGKFIKTLFEETHPKYVEPENPVWFLPDSNNEFLWLSERDGFMHVYHYNTDGKLLNQLTKGDYVVTKILGLSHSRKKLIIEGTDESGLNKYAYSINIKNGKRKKLSKKSGVHSYKLDDSGAFLVDQYSSLKTPFVVDVINTRGKHVSTLLASTDPLAGYQVGKTELVELQTKDGTPLHARIIKPSNFDSRKKYPVLVYVYGGPHAQMVSNRRLAGAPLWMHYMAQKGYIIFTLDGRGSANRGFNFENVIHRDLGNFEVKDQMTGVDYLKSLPFVDADRMAVHGWSYGGFMTTTMMLKTPDVFKAGIAGGPVTNWEYYEAMYGERYMDRPEENPEGYKQANLMNHASKLKGDLLLIHGTVDDVVVMQHNLALVQKFVEEGIQIDFFPYPMHPHNVRGKDRIHLMEKVLNYVEEKLK
ncbi:MAG: DPP IV N-terminal domain-containing protein [Saprospiraceae bacterium]